MIPKKYVLQENTILVFLLKKKKCLNQRVTIFLINCEI